MSKELIVLMTSTLQIIGLVVAFYLIIAILASIMVVFFDNLAIFGE